MYMEKYPKVKVASELEFCCFIAFVCLFVCLFVVFHSLHNRILLGFLILFLGRVVGVNFIT